MKIHNKFYYKEVLIFICLIIATGCATTTKPNPPYYGPYPAGFDTLAEQNPLLVQELGKIPEIQDGISGSEEMALKRICKLFKANTEDFNTMFELMYNEGIPDIRKFCTPLQALLWLALDGRLELFDLSEFTMTKLLDEAWYKPGFEYEGKGRWDSFTEVTDRLNSPFLLDYYEARNFTYKVIQGASRSPYELFAKKVGDCEYYTSFSVYCLRKSGYRAHAITVIHGRSNKPNHVACLYYDKYDRDFIMDNTLRAYVGKSGIYEKQVYLNLYPYVRQGYLN